MANVSSSSFASCSNSQMLPNEVVVADEGLFGRMQTSSRELEVSVIDEREQVSQIDMIKTIADISDQALIDIRTDPIQNTPTARHLKMHPVETIIGGCDFVQDLSERFPLLLEIAGHETKNAFFGYHGMTQRSRLFQDILRVVFETVLEIPLPKNFYFFRIPSNKAFHWEKGADSFLDRFGNRKLSSFHQNLIVENFLIIIEKAIGLGIKLDDFSDHEISTIWSYFESFIKWDIRQEWIRKAGKYSIPEEYPLKESPTEHLTDLISVINQKLIIKYPDFDPEKFPQWIQNKFNHYFERSIFYLRELHSVSKEDKDFIYRFLDPFYDVAKPQNKILVSLNIPLFGNYLFDGSFTPQIYLSNKSVLGGDEKMKKLLSKFFDRIGLDSSLIDPLWLEGQNIIEESNHTGGCLIQLYDESVVRGEAPLSFVDRNAYVSLKHGLPMPELAPSQIIEGHFALTRNEKDLELRLLMDNKTTLNPFSSLRMVRYDGLPAEYSEKILNRMKVLLSNSVKDNAKLQQYKEELKELWGADL
ncbi:MAG: hypothetical protein ACHQUC_07890 [Chlamydiales bacterium]